jgi:hypothetical protein
VYRWKFGENKYFYEKILCEYEYSFVIGTRLPKAKSSTTTSSVFEKKPCPNVPQIGIFFNLVYEINLSLL